MGDAERLLLIPDHPGISWSATTYGRAGDLEPDAVRIALRSPCVRQPVQQEKPESGTTPHFGRRLGKPCLRTVGRNLYTGAVGKVPDDQLERSLRGQSRVSHAEVTSSLTSKTTLSTTSCAWPCSLATAAALAMLGATLVMGRTVISTFAFPTLPPEDDTPAELSSLPPGGRGRWVSRPFSNRSDANPPSPR